MAIETLPEPSIPITTPFRSGLGFLTATPIIAVATVCLALVILSSIFAPLLTSHDPQLLAPAKPVPEPGPDAESAKEQLGLFG